MIKNRRTEEIDELVRQKREIDEKIRKLKQFSECYDCGRFRASSDSISENKSGYAPVWKLQFRTDSLSSSRYNCLLRIDTKKELISSISDLIDQLNGLKSLMETSIEEGVNG